MGRVFGIPWLLLGDFNQVLWRDGKRGRSPVSQARVQPFVNMIKNCKLLDLDFSGQKFTWSNMRKGITNIQE